MRAFFVLFFQIRTSLRGTKITDQRELINSKLYRANIKVWNLHDYLLVGDCFIPRKDVQAAIAF
jgi:hypothetical protein